VILDGKETVLYGDPYIEETLLDCVFRISARSFFQINPYATELLYSTAIEYAGLTGKETVIDLYCGTGTIGILASKYAKHVYGIEIVADAVKDAKVNAERNGVNNITFFTADARQGARRLIENRIHADVVIVDPPRKGCSKETLDAILEIAPDRLVYVSCDPSTLARDCRYLDEHGYHVEIVQPADMFPMTEHVETVVCLSNKNARPKNYVETGVDAEDYRIKDSGKK
jgi:23S rRNA (uracil1939-C5)-methyltransferase